MYAIGQKILKRIIIFGNFSFKERLDVDAQKYLRIFYPSPNKKSRKKTAVWDVTPCSLVDCYHSFGGIYCLRLQGRRVDLSWKIGSDIGRKRINFHALYALVP
jgi:hypothetical protein